MSRPAKGMTPERAMHRVRELRQDHLVARAADCSLVECAKIIREAETLEEEIYTMRAKNVDRDARIVKCALDNQELTMRELGERFGITWQAVSVILGDAGVTKNEGGHDGRWEKKTL